MTGVTFLGRFCLIRVKGFECSVYVPPLPRQQIAEHTPCKKGGGRGGKGGNTWIIPYLCLKKGLYHCILHSGGRRGKGGFFSESRDNVN